MISGKEFFVRKSSATTEPRCVKQSLRREESRFLKEAPETLEDEA
jgi:hypothetical protein